MKLFWKIFLSVLCIVMIVCQIFGIALIYVFFNDSMEREVQREVNEDKMIMIMLRESVGVNMQEEDENNSELIKNTIQSFKGSIGQERYYIRVYDEQWNIIYDDNNEITSLISKEEIQEKTACYIISNQNHTHYLENMYVLRIKKQNYYVSIFRNIQYLYDDRREIYQKYIWMLMGALFISAVLAYTLSKKVTRPIIKLSRAAQRLSAGDYKARAEISGAGEVKTLIKNFNMMADKLEEDITELEDSARKQEDFTASFAHELKTPLTAIVGYSDMLRSMELEKEEITEYSNYIFVQGKRLEKLSYTMMDLISVDKQNIEFTKISMKNLMQMVENIVQPSIHEKKIQLKMKTRQGFVYGNTELLVSLFVNLIDNARKAVSVEGTILVEGEEKSDMYILSIQDNGCGMESSEIRKITEAFYMIDKSRARKEGGAGIGMALCQKIVSVHNAKWKIKSEVGVGTTIAVELTKYDEKGSGINEN